MGKVSNIDKTKFVEYNKATGFSRCLLCNKLLKGYLLGNIRRHYETIHKQKFKKIIAPSTSDKRGIKRRNSNQSCLKLNKKDFLKCCVGMVAVENIPFRVFDDAAYFKQIIEPYEDQYNLQLNSKNIAEHIHLFANQIKNNLKQTFLKKMLSLKVDVAARMGMSILVINVQYIQDFEIVINTIGMTQLKQEHTAYSLKEEILKCLQEFDIDLTQIYSTTIDNGAYMLNTSRQLEQDILDLQNDEFETNSENYNDDYEIVHDHLNSVLAVNRCAAHTIQLAAQDVLPDLRNEVEQCRKAVKLLRASIRDSSVDLHSPPIDNIAQWNSTFEMIESLLSLKHHINGNEMSIFIDCKIDWDFVENFVDVFTPLAQCTKELQAEQYIIGDFYRDWLVCEAKLKKMGENALAIKLLDSMKKRKEKLFDNFAFLSGIYFDPRFNFLDSPFINDDQNKTAVVHILKTNATLTALNGEGNSSNDRIDHKDNVHVSRPCDPYNILEEELNSLTTSRLTTQNSPNIRQKLENLAYCKRMPFATDVLEYWKNLSTKERELSKLAEVILAAPSSQVSIGRAFSALSTIITKQRSRLNSDTINSLLIVKLNKNLL